MTTTVFLAVIGAAVLHATWNAFVKGGLDKRVGMSAIVLGHLPFAIAALFWVPLPGPASYPYLVGGIIFHFGYQLFLLNSYRIGDLTQVYPIARGVAPLIVTGISVLGLGVVLGRAELAGVVIIGIGILSLTLVRRADGQRNPKAAGLAVITGCFIAGYSLIDGLGARAAGTALGYYGVLSIANGILWIAFIAWRSPSVFRDVAGSGQKVFWLGGGASFLAYSIVTWAFTQAPIALVTALRETSIIFALLIGVFWMGERLSLGKLAATAITLGGAVLMRLGRF